MHNNPYMITGFEEMIVGKTENMEGNAMEFIMKELKSICKEHQFTDEENRILINEAKRILTLATMSRKEGLLALLSLVKGEIYLVGDGIDLFEKYAVSPLVMNTFDQNMLNLLEDVTNGVNAEFIWKIGEITLCTSYFSPVEFMQYVIFLDGVINIQGGYIQTHLKRLWLRIYL